MANTILTGNSDQFLGYIEDYIQKHRLKPYEIEYFQEKIKIEDARHIKKTLSFRAQGQRLFVLSGEFTDECQNALLKTLEESSEGVHFIFCVDREDALLATILSRCTLIKLSSNEITNEKISNLIIEIQQRRDNSWNEIDALSTYVKENGMNALLPVMRQLILKSLTNGSELAYYYSYCKRLYPQMQLSSSNNINEKIILESVFLK